MTTDVMVERGEYVGCSGEFNAERPAIPIAEKDANN
jgi:hypothetical protein